MALPTGTATMAVKAYLFVGNTWQAALWDCLPLVLWAIVGWKFWRHSTVRFGRYRFATGWVLSMAAAFLNATDEFLGLNETPILGRNSVWHEGIETVLAVVGLALVLSAINRWMRE